ncbi:MAG: ATP-binding domain-containing protein, partial [Rhodocyclales bacterium]|nr:ATP-binding domain-containing protein [Rhodocyclales bacterium]
FEHRTHFKDYAILYRGNHQARLFEQQLRNHKIPYAISGGRSFFENAEIKDLCAYLRLLANEDDDLAFIRALTVPRRGVGPATIEALGRYAALRHVSLFTAVFEEGVTQHVQPRQLEALRDFGHFINRMAHRAPREPAGPVLNDLLKAINYEAWLYESCDPREAETKWGNVGDFSSWLGRKGEEDGKTLLDMIQTITLITMLDKEEAELDEVQLATLHASKGLEFKHVFLVGVEEGLLPHQSSIDEDKIEEERRLMYVGITRAQRTLTISYCERRKSGRDVRTCDPSRFIDEMGEDGVRRNDRKSTAPLGKEDAKARIANLRALLGKGPGG